MYNRVKNLLNFILNQRFLFYKAFLLLFTNSKIYVNVIKLQSKDETINSKDLIILDIYPSYSRVNIFYHSKTSKEDKNK